MPTVTPCLWGDFNADEAVDFYRALFDDVEVLERQEGEGGRPFWVRLRLVGTELILLIAGPHYQLSPAFSLFVSVETQDEVDHYWDGLLEGGTPSRCGWLTDRYGISWQIVPTALHRLMGDPDPERAGRVREAMLGMIKLDIAGLQAAYDG